jgi:uncharacterized protein YutE (UPF0331/DUF86 family)/predicted nucleotidyltransferase
MKVDLCLNPKVFTREEVFSKLKGVQGVLRRHNVQLAYLFGSILRERRGPLSDVDIAILPDIERYHWLNTYSDIYSDLCHIFGADNVDVLMLNEAPPPIAFAVIRDGLLIYLGEGAEEVEFAEEAIFAYHDTQPLRDEHWHYLCQRIKEGLSKAMRKVDKDKINLLLGKMDEAIIRLKGISSIGEEEFLAEENWQTRALAEHFLRIAIEAAIDVGRHIIVAKGLGIPERYKDVGRILKENRVVTQRLGDKLVEMAGMRNILVHLYWDIDYHRLYEAITTQLSDFDEYACCILDFIAEEE